MMQAYVALGSNLDAPAAQVRAAMAALDELPGTRVSAASSLYRTPPVGFLAQPDFINAVVALETAMGPDDLLAALHALEARFGRVRSFRNAPRVLDLDLLWHAGIFRDDPGLTLPHPRMHERAFVLLPLAEIAPAFMLPGIGPVCDRVRVIDTAGIERLSDEPR